MKRTKWVLIIGKNLKYSTKTCKLEKTIDSFLPECTCEQFEQKTTTFYFSWLAQKGNIETILNTLSKLFTPFFNQVGLRQSYFVLIEIHYLVSITYESKQTKEFIAWH